MRHSEFEEREYEAPLYVQLQHGITNVWSPGQVLEAHVGFDYAFLTSHPRFWMLQGFSLPPTGVLLGAFPLHHWWNSRSSSRPLPDFSLNLFIQAKRPLVGLRAKKSLKSYGINAPYWKFVISPDQQLVLESLAKSTSSSALVCYACAAFDRVTELWAHSRGGTIIETSTFPTAASLRGHNAWYYNSPGCSGVANPRLERIVDLSLAERVSRFTSQRPEAQSAEASFGSNLKALAAAVYESLSEDAIGNTARSAVYFEALRDIDNYMDFVRPPRHAGAVRDFLAVAMFASVFGLGWHALAQGDA
jgi:hypothetical protein